MALQRLKEAAEKAKMELSTTMETEINLPFITADASGPKHMNITLTRAKMEQLVMDLVEKTLEPCKQAVTDAGVFTENVTVNSTSGTGKVDIKKDTIGKTEAGEDCDPPNGECCDAQCKFVPAGTSCRGQTDDCDKTEYCTGNSASCPADQPQPAGTVCRAKSGDCDKEEKC
jgi:hypothetical protein